MKLTELNPYFDGQGDNACLVFDCPKPAAEHYDHVHKFRIPIAGDRKWDIDSLNFETMTMRPSIQDATSGYPGEKPYCGIHFFITKGEIQIL